MANKEIPMQPDIWFNKVIKCGRCSKCLDIIEHRYCPQCGQKIDWTKIPDEVDVLFAHDRMTGAR